MILNCEYTTDTDIGEITSKAKLDTQSGEVFNIKMPDDEHEEIKEIYQIYIRVKYQDKNYYIEVINGDGINEGYNFYEYECDRDSKDLKELREIINIIKLKNDLEGQLEPKEKTRKNKI